MGYELQSDRVSVPRSSTVTAPSKRIAAIIPALLIAGVSWAVPAAAGNLPFVGCRSDGQIGPQAAPRAGRTPTVPGKDAAKLAFYAMADGTRVIAPRGWRCFGRYGSSGSVLVVAPTAQAWAERSGKSTYTGPAVVRQTTFGSTSGRFEVAAFAARYFPVARSFVDAVAAEGVDDSFPSGTPPDDRITRRGNYEILYTTPPGVRGTGTRADLAPGPFPVDGIAILAADEDHDLQTMDARLPAAIRPLVAHIIRDVEQSAATSMP